MFLLTGHCKRPQKEEKKLRTVVMLMKKTDFRKMISIAST
jgi:hypothetical protein